MYRPVSVRDMGEVTQMETKIGLPNEQVESLTGPTPEENILTRDSGFGPIQYVTGEYVTRKLVEAFNGALRITVREVEWKDQTCITHLRLEYPIIDFNVGGSFVYEEWAHVDEVGVSVAREKFDGLDYGNALKGSMTDALKRAGMRLGIGLDRLGF